MQFRYFIHLLLCLILGLFVSACSKKTEQVSTDAASADVVADSTRADAAAANAEVSENEKLGTKWGG